jgi:molybdenum cofactor cytidylyltransferase
MRIAGILLAAGSGSRFGGDKLLAPLPDGTPIGVRSASNLAAVLPDTIAVVRPGDAALGRALAAAGVRVTACADAHTGMGASLAHAVGEAGVADGYVIALADMPWISAGTLRGVADALACGAPIVVPRYRGQRGHPVGFGAGYRDALLRLTGDAGARSILAAATGIRWLEVEDPGTLRDVDVPADLSEG